MPISARRLAVAVFVVAGLTLVGACGGDGGSGRSVDAGADLTPGTEPATRPDPTVAVSNDFIRVESPGPGESITSPVVVSGENRTFENNVRIRIVAANGTVLADTFTTGNGEPGVFGDFSKSVGFVKGANPGGTIEVFADSPKDGSEVYKLEIPVDFA